jgi:hypothetical protein
MTENDSASVCALLAPGNFDTQSTEPKVLSNASETSICCSATDRLAGQEITKVPMRQMVRIQTIAHITISNTHTIFVFCFISNRMMEIATSMLPWILSTTASTSRQTM